MNLGLNDIFAVIDKVKCAELEGFEYSDMDMKIKIRTGDRRADERNSRKENIKDYDEDKEKGCTIEFPMEKERNVNNEGDVVSPEKIIFVESPMVGTFYVAPSEGAEPFVSVGDKVKKGQVIGIIEAMKLMNEIEAHEDGVVEEILVDNEQMVEFGQVLLKIRK